MVDNKPLVSIGMPVYNGDRYIRLALDSLLAQDYENFQIIISDNASTDRTPQICQEYAAICQNIHYYRNATNLGSAKNFNRSFQLSFGKYFMWAAHDDLWEKTYISRCVAQLEDNPSAVLCCSEITFLNEEGSVRYDWTLSIRNLETLGMSISERVHQLISRVGWFAIYGVIRSESLKKTNLFLEKYGTDVILLLELLLLGEFVKVPERLFYYRIPEKPKEAQEYMKDIDPLQCDREPKQPYTFLARELLKVVLESKLEEVTKCRIRKEFIETLCFKNLDWRSRIFKEHQSPPEIPASPQQLREFIEGVFALELRKQIAPKNHHEITMIPTQVSLLTSEFDAYYARIREPKKRTAISYDVATEEKISQRLRQLGIQLEDYEIDVAEYQRYFQAARYREDFPHYFPSNLPEKSLEHYIAAKLLQFNSHDIYIDIASQCSPVPAIYNRLFGTKVYRQDLDYPPGLNGETIGGDAANIPVPNEFATKMALHCSFEHFEGDSDISFVQEAARILKPGGAVCILPLYLAEEYAIQTDPVISVPQGVKFEDDAVIYCAPGWQNRHGRFYDPEHLIARIANNLNGISLKIYRIKNAQQVDESCYVRFVAMLTKPKSDRRDINVSLLQEVSAGKTAEESKEKKALVFFPHNPYPPQTGAHKRCMEMLEALKELGYDITLFSYPAFADNPWESSSINDLQNKFGVKVVIYPGSQADGEYMAQVNATSRGAFNWEIYTPPGLRDSFRQLFVTLSPQVVITNYSLWGKLAIGDEFKSAVTIIDTIDLFTLNLKMRQAVGRYIGNSSIAPHQINPKVLEEDFYSQLQLDADADEYAIFDEYDCTIAISSHEAQAMRKHAPRTQVEYIPMTFAAESLNNSYTGAPLFAIGDNPFNVQGYWYFATKVLPMVRSQLPEFSLQVVGTGCKRLVAVEGVQLLGFVPDLKPLYTESRFALCPLIGGTGQQVKIVEAMAHGVPVIALRNVAHTSPIEHGVNGLIANNATEFAEYTVQLFRNRQLCRQLGQAARETIAKNFSRQVLVERLKQMIETAQSQPSVVKPIFIVDGVFFQLDNTGIASVWKSVLGEWAANGFAKHILVLDRAGTAPKIPGIQYRTVPPYNYGKSDAERQMLQQICDEERADLFISTYYTTPVSTPSIFMGYDMIPEVVGQDLDNHLWREKHTGIRHASSYITISKNTSRDLVRFFPHIAPASITVAHCGIKNNFSPASSEEIEVFKSEFGIAKPYFLLVGERIGWKGYKNGLLFFKAFSQIHSSSEFEIVCTGGAPTLEEELKAYSRETKVHLLRLSDEQLRCAYSGAVALVYPSAYEGFGLPVLEAMACGCPTITCPNASIPEVAGSAALYVNYNDVGGLVKALGEVQKPEIRSALIAAGLERSKQFSWSKMANTMEAALMQTATQLSSKRSPVPSTIPGAVLSLSTGFPKIPPITANIHRPFWSVMIPTYNRVKYLEQALKSVLQQAPSSEEMQIEVVNDCSNQSIQDEMEAIVKAVGGGRVNFYRHPEQDIGQTAIFNLCIQRSQGEWVHILHDDDVVLPGFYSRLREGIEKEPSVGAAFCRHIYTDEAGNQRWVSWLERETPGVLSDWLEQIIVMCRLQASPIAVKRSVYENLGGFCPQAGAASDWEMWKRIAVHYQIWYEPEPLAWYRQHSSSDNTRLLKSGGLIADVRRSIEISQSYLPSAIADKLSNQAREHYALYALNTAKKLLTDGDSEAAIAQIREGLKCSQSAQLKEALVSLLLLGESHQPSTGFSSSINQQQKDSSNESASVNSQPTRKQIAEMWLNLPAEQLASAFAGDTGKAHQALLAGDIRYEPLTDTEETFVSELVANVAKGFNEPKAINYLLAAMLYRRADQLPLKYDRATVPNWFANEYLKFMFTCPNLFQTRGEADSYYQFIQGWVDYVHSNIFKNPDSQLWQNIALFFSQVANFIPLYFTTTNLRDIYTKRAEIIEVSLKNRGCSIDCIFPARSPNRTKIRLGIISDHFAPQTETFATIPVFEHLNRNQFEIYLYALNTSGHQLEQYCQSRADKLVALPKDFASQVQTIRADDLDILFFGTNLTAINKPVASLAMHRLARVQTTSFCSPTTTGIRHMDYYIAGQFTAPDASYQEQYREELAVLEGSGFCFKYATESEVATVKPTRQSLGISDTKTVFISGANFYKILPELRETWLKILAAVPDSVLILYPFGPAWTRTYPTTPFVNNMNAVCAKYGVNNNRLLFIKQLPTRADVKEFLQLADVYLDSYPYAGATSLIDPLQVGLPTVVVEGNALRFRQGSAMLRELQMSDLIAYDEASYIQLAVTLGTNPQLRQRYRQEIQQKMQGNPRCFDSVAYSGAIGKLFQELFGKWQTSHQEASRSLQDSIPKQPDLGEILSNTVKLYQRNSSNISAISELRQIRKQIADFWLNLPAENLETAYKSDPGNSYKIMLASGFQHQAMIESEQIFLQQLTQISKGLVHPKAVNALLAAMLYFPPGTMRIPDARNRLPHWLIGDYEQVFETEAAVKSDSSSDLLAQYIQSPQFANQLLGCVNLYRIDPSDESVVLELRQIRQQMADFWLTVPSEKLENFYRGGVGKGYQAILKCGLQAEAMTEAEQKFLQRLTEISKGLVQPQAINALLGAMLYFVPGKMRVPDARTRLPQWLLEDYEKVFESAFATTEQTVVKQDYLPQFLNQLTAAVNLYEIDPTAELVIADLRHIRKQIADLWLSVSGEKLEVLYQSDFGKGYKAMLGSGFINEPLHESDREFFNSLVVELSKGFGAPKAVNNLLAAMLYCRPGQLRVQDANTCLPPWLLADYEQLVGGAIELAVK